MTAEDILQAIRRKHNRAAIVSEVVLTDEYELSLCRRHQIDSAGPALAARYRRIFERSGEVVADVLPEGWDAGASKSIRRIDGLMLEGGRFTSIEIKLTRADFRRDTEEKRRAWRNVTDRFVYATPKGLLSPSELPAYAGLWEFDPLAHWRHQVASVKRATTNKSLEPLPQQIVTAMFYRAARAEQSKIGRSPSVRR